MPRWIAECRICGACAPDLGALPEAAAALTGSAAYRALGSGALRWAALVAGTPAEAEALLQAAWAADDAGEDATALRRRAASVWPVPADTDDALRLIDVLRRAGEFARAIALLDALTTGDDATRQIAAFQRARIDARDTRRHLISSALRPPSRTPHAARGAWPSFGWILGQIAWGARKMTWDEAFEALGSAGDLPDPVIDELMAAWDKVQPRCLQLLHDYVAGRDESEHTERALYNVVHMLAEKRETAAFQDICRLVSDPDRSDLVLGDDLIGNLPGILINCFDGDAAPLRLLVERVELDSLVRERVLLTLAYLGCTGRIAKSDIHAYLVTLFDTLQPQAEDVVWTAWVSAVALLCFGALAGRAATLFERGFIPDDYMRLQDFKNDLRRAKEDPDSLEGFDLLDIGPLTRVTQGWDSEGSVSAPPYVNPLRNVGRNDPCPCGSGRKYKKCCLA